MIEKIDESLCTGCGICVNSCCMDVLRMDQKKKKAVIQYIEDCCCCNMCRIDCPVRAVEVSWKMNTTPITSWGL
jgi:NAD-dependent dihydropyrimidine dehydrogenase PreA subunit